MAYDGKSPRRNDEVSNHDRIPVARTNRLKRLDPGHVARKRAWEIFDRAQRKFGHQLELQAKLSGWDTGRGADEGH